MTRKHLGRQSVRFDFPPSILSYASVVGKKEGEGPLAAYFDTISSDTKFGQQTWEKAESQMQTLALQGALRKASLSPSNVHMLFAGDLLNQCIGTSFAARGTDIPFYGLYGACSTMAESLSLAAMAVEGGYAEIAAAVTSSHFASAERQYRLPLEYGGQRTPTAQWTQFSPMSGNVNTGRILLKGVEDDKYIITEIETDDGYKLLKEDISVEITAQPGAATCSTCEAALLTASAKVNGSDVQMNEDSSSVNAIVPLTVTNTRGYDLPKTGGSGTKLFYIFGVLGLMAGGAAIVMGLRKRRNA